MFGTPEGCERTECTYYWAMGPNNENPSYLDIYMEGDVSGWLAVGFSENKLMVIRVMINHYIEVTHEYCVTDNDRCPWMSYCLGK